MNNNSSMNNNSTMNNNLNMNNASHFPALMLSSHLPGTSRQGNGDQGIGDFFGSQHSSGIPAVDQATMYRTMTMGVQQNLTPDQLNRKRTFDQSSGYIFSNLPWELGDKITTLMRQQQMETDSLIIENAKKLKMDVVGRQTHLTKQMLASLSGSYMGKMQEKNNEIWGKDRHISFLEQQIQKLNEEKKSLADTLMTSEANANSLQGKMDQILDYYNSHERLLAFVNAEEVESGCDSNTHIVEFASENEGGNDGFVPDKYKCKGCGRMEASVLLLPCRHLCLCASCGNGMRRPCPFCGTMIDATVRVNMM